MDSRFSSDANHAADRGPALDSAERARQREIKSYLSAASFPATIPSGHPGIGKASLCPDRTLVQLVQLAPLRLDCSRAIFSFIDYENEYVVCETTQQRTPFKKQAVSHPELLVGVAKIPHTDMTGMCPHVVETFNDETGDNEEYGPYIFADRRRYIVTDMQKEPKYKDKHGVKLFKPGLRSFLGVPIISPLGYVLGALMVAHAELRDWSEDDVAVLEEVAEAIMTHLELIRAKECRGRSEKLMKGLSEFMERDSPIPHERTFSMSTRATSERTFSEAPDSVEGANDVIQHVENYDIQDTTQPMIIRPITHSHQSASTMFSSVSSDNIFTPSAVHSHSTSLSTPFDGDDRDPFDVRDDAARSQQPPHDFEEQAAPPSPESTISEEVKNTFQRAADLIRASMNFSGLFFADAMPSSFGSRSNTTAHHEDRADPFVSDTGDSIDIGVEKEEELPDLLARSVDPCLEKPEAVKHLPQDRSPIPQSIIQRWAKRYPRGHIFSADEHGFIDCRYAPGNDLCRLKNSRSRNSRAINDARDLFEKFNHVRYLAFLPLWHFQKECWFAATFAWINFESQQSMVSADINLLTAFGNSVMAEVSRIEAVSLSRAKSDFISSVSHELRSPLHGILASGELLRESLDDPSLLSMVDMIDSCGTTLLDTFNNLLDYAKINNVAKANKKNGGEEHESRKVNKKDTRSVDLSALVQEVVETVNLGHMSKTAFQAHQVSPAVFTSLAELAEAEEEYPDHSVIVTMNIEKRPSWQTRVDPGAWKRVVMNLVGNALKYTRSGLVEVGLKIIDLPSEQRRGESCTNICFSVRDTGIGMSADYLKYQLFTPFAQENNLSPGTGLGLSIVNQLVKGLDGTLDVKSQIGIGTHIKVFVPLQLETAGPLGEQMPPIDEISQFDVHGKLHGRTLQVIGSEAYKILVNPTMTITHEIREREKAVRTALKHIAADTLGMSIVYGLPDDKKPADIYLFDAYLIGTAVHCKTACAMHQEILRFSPLVIMCSGAGPLQQLKKQKLKGNMLQLRHPIGPKKLAETFINALEVGKLQRSLQSNNHLQTIGDTGVLGHKQNETENQAKTFQTSLDVPLYEPLASVKGEGPRKEALATDSKLPLREEKDEHAHRPTPTPVQHHVAPRAALPPSISSPAVMTGRAGKQNQHLLLVDDNPINLKILTTLVKKLSHTFETASNGLEAVQLYKASLIQNQPFDFIFMDISMPVMNGFEATREIRKVEREEKVHATALIAALTGLGSESSKQEAFASGTNLFLMKPVKLAEIKKLLNDEKVRDLEIVHA